MSAQQLLADLQAMPPGAPLDFKAIRARIHDEADKPITTQERVILLSVFKAVMDNVERRVSEESPDGLSDFRNARLSDYRLLVIKEAMVGENVCADTLNEVTLREVEAGRMSADDEVRVLASQRVAVPHPSRAQLEAMRDQPSKPKGFFSRLLGK